MVNKLRDFIETPSANRIPVLYALNASIPTGPTSVSPAIELVRAIHMKNLSSPILVQIVKDAMKKSMVANIDAIMAIRLIVEISDMTPNILDQHKLWVAFQPGSFLYSKAVLQLFKGGVSLKDQLRLGEEMLKSDILKIISDMFFTLSTKFPTFFTEIFTKTTSSGQSSKLDLKDTKQQDFFEFEVNIFF